MYMLHSHMYQRNDHWLVTWLIKDPMSDRGAAGGSFEFGSSLDGGSDSPVELLERMAHALGHCAQSYRSTRGSSWPTEGELPIWAGYGRGHTFHSVDELVELEATKPADPPW